MWNRERKREKERERENERDDIKKHMWEAESVIFKLFKAELHEPKRKLGFQGQGYIETKFKKITFLKTEKTMVLVLFNVQYILSCRTPY
jgi:hypothetical protein